MDAQRFSDFRQDLSHLFGTLIEKFSDTKEFVEASASELKNKYLELCESTTLTTSTASKTLSYEEIKTHLVKSIKDRHFKNFSGIEKELKNDRGVKGYLQNIKLLTEAIKNSRKHVVYFSCLQGDYLARIKEENTKKCSFVTYLKQLGISKAHGYFLVRLHKPVTKNNAIIYSD